MNRTRLLGIVAAACVIIGGAIIFWPTARIDKPTKSISTIIAFGDSLTVGVGAGEQGGWVPSAEKILNALITRVAKSGITTEDGLKMIEDVRSQKPDMVILFLGGNDALQRLPTEGTFKNLKAIIDRLKSDGAFVVLVGVQGGILGDRYKSEFASLAKIEHVPLVPEVLSGVFGNASLMSDDSIHPNEAGYKIIGQRIAGVIKEYIVR